MAHGGRRHGLAPRGKADRLVISLSPDDRAGLEEIARVLSDGEDQPLSLAQAVRTLIRDAIREDRRCAAEMRGVEAALRAPRPRSRPG